MVVVLRALLRRLLHGRDEMYLPASWLENIERLREYEAWTLRQREGQVVTTPLEMKRRALWAEAVGRMVEDTEGRREVLKFRRKANG